MMHCFRVFHYCVLSCALVFVSDYRKYLVSVNIVRVVNSKLCTNDSILSCVVRLLSRILHSVICRVVMMKPTVLSPMKATLVRCFPLPECRIKLLDGVVCLALWCNFC